MPAKTMTITLPHVPRSLPNITEVEDVLLVICHKAELDPEKASFHIAGGQRRHMFSQRGVKLLSVRSEHLGVPMFVGCTKDSVEGHMKYGENETDRLTASQLHAKLLATFGNRKVHLVDDVRIRQIRHAHKNGTTTPTATPVPAQVAVAPVPAQAVPIVPGAPVIENLQATVPEPHLPPLMETPSTDSPSAKVEPKLERPPLDLQNEPGSFARNQKNVQLALVAFNTRFKLHEPFKFNDFRKVIEEDVGVIHSAGAKIHVRSFLGPGFLVRLNPENPSNARYTITELCVQIAEADDYEALRLILLHQQLGLQALRQKHEEEEETPEPPKSFVEQAQLLRQLEGEYQQLLRDITSRSSELDKLNARDLSKEETDICGQINNLENRLQVLRTALEEISKSRQRLQLIGTEIEELRKRTTNGKLAKAHQEFEELKKQFLG